MSLFYKNDRNREDLYPNLESNQASVVRPYN